MTNRTAFITGASRGIGRACALALSEAGARVALAARNTAQLEELAAEIRSQGREAFAVTIDMTSAESIQEALAKTAKEFGPVGDSGKQRRHHQRRARASDEEGRLG